MKRKTVRKIAAVIALLCLGAVVLTGCGGSSSGSGSGTDGDGISIYVGETIFDSSLDPVKGAFSYGYPVINNALTKVTPESTYAGDLALDWEVSSDALTYTFHLREGVTFHDGSDFTAEDVVFTYNTVKENQGGNDSVDLSRMASVEATDDHTVVFTLTEPYSSFLDQTACLGIVPSDGYDSRTFDTMPIGTGPWKVIQYDTAQKMILGANEDYYGGAPSIEQATILDMEEDAAIASARSGELDLAMVSPNYVNEEIDGMHIENLETMDVRQISLPVTPQESYRAESGDTVTVGNDVTSDRAVREALSIGIDRQTIIDNALNGIGKPAEGFTDNLEWGNTASYEDNRKDEARALLEAAGWEEGKDDIYQKDGLRCEFTVYAPSGDTARYQLAQAVAEEAEKIGIKIDVDQATWDELDTEAFTSGVVWGWGQYDPVVLRNLFYSGAFTGTGTANTVRYSNAEADRLIEAALDANSREASVEAWKQVQSVTANDYAYLYIVNIEHSYFVSDDLDISVDTQIPHPHGHGAPVINNMNQWTLK
ncbi:MAG: ABC transporter substrate-binding protein [Anaerovoracaceae bacterium]